MLSILQKFCGTWDKGTRKWAWRKLQNDVPGLCLAGLRFSRALLQTLLAAVAAAVEFFFAFNFFMGHNRVPQKDK
jgi:hypothetical protein